MQYNNHQDNTSNNLDTVLKAGRKNEPHSADVLKYVEAACLVQILIQNHAIGIDFVDTYARTDLLTKSLSLGIGRELVGMVNNDSPDMEGFDFGYGGCTSSSGHI